MLAGIIVASFQFFIDKYKTSFAQDSLLYELSNVQAIYLFPIIFSFSLSGAFLGMYLSKPTDMKTLKSFYKTVNPWGWWNPVYKELKNDDINTQKNTDFWSDMLNCAIGIIWQSSMILMPIYLIVRDYSKLSVTFVIFAITSVILKFRWLDKIRK